MMDLFILRLSRWLGALPFHLHKDGKTPAFRWLSWNTLIFTCVGLVWHVCLVNNVVIVFKEMIRSSDSKKYTAYFWAPVTMLTLVLNSWIVLARRDVILKSFCKLESCRERAHPRWGIKLDKKMRIYSWIWIFLGCGIRLVVIMLHNFFHPEFPLYFTHLLCSPGDNGDMAPACLAAGMAAMSVVIILYMFSFLTVEFVPLYFSVGFRLAFDEINQEIMKLAKPSTSTREVVSKSEEISVVTNPQDDNAPAPTTNLCLQHSMQEQKSLLLRHHLNRHRRVQRRLHYFNCGFSPLIILFVSHTFVMPINLFFTILRFPLESGMELASLFINGVEFLVRSSIVLYAFGAVRESCEEMKRILLSELPLSNLAEWTTKEIVLFVSQLDDVYVSAGSYVYFSKGFLISFYGILVTYVTISAQSV